VDVIERGGGVVYVWCIVRCLAAGCDLSVYASTNAGGDQSATVLWSLRLTKGGVGCKACTIDDELVLGRCDDGDRLTALSSKPSR
jgi:hypothetical protein